MSTVDRIELRGLRVVAVVGARPEERTQPQPIELDLDVVLDLDAAGASDRLDDTLDYGALCREVEAVVSTAAPQLLERLATLVADAVLAHGEVRSVTVAVRKLRPPVAHDLATAGVRLTRHR